MSRDRQIANWSSQSGQSLIETALLIPLLLLLIFNVINFSYYFLVGIHLASAPREGAQYSIMGFYTPGQLDLPSAASVSGLTHRDMAALVDTSGATVRVCTVRRSGAAVDRSCTVFNSKDACTFSDADPDPAGFALHRVDVCYRVTPLINAAPFRLTVLPSYTFYRQVSMREM